LENILPHKHTSEASICKMGFQKNMDHSEHFQLGGRRQVKFFDEQYKN
jgi:hypothetical protein